MNEDLLFLFMLIPVGVALVGIALAVVILIALVSRPSTVPTTTTDPLHSLDEITDRALRAIDATCEQYVREVQQILSGR